MTLNHVQGKDGGHELVPMEKTYHTDQILDKSDHDSCIFGFSETWSWLKVRKFNLDLVESSRSHDAIGKILLSKYECPFIKYFRRYEPYVYDRQTDKRVVCSLLIPPAKALGTKLNQTTPHYSPKNIWIWAYIQRNSDINHDYLYLTGQMKHLFSPWNRSVFLLQVPRRVYSCS